MNQVMYDLYGNKTMHKIGELIFLCMHINEKTEYNIHATHWGHYSGVDIALYCDGKINSDTELFRTSLNFKKTTEEIIAAEYDKSKKMRVSVCFEVLRFILKEKKIHPQIKKQIDGLIKKMEVKNEG